MKMIFLLFFLLFQQEETISRAYKAPYVRATDNCKNAVDLIETNPKEAIQILTDILDNPKIKKRECRIKWEITPGTHSRQYDFFPYQYRGRARMRLAEKTPEQEKAIDLLDLAVEDFEESVRKGLSSSKSHLSQAKKAIKNLEKSAPIDPEPEFRKTWRRFVSENRYDAAKGHIEAKGSFLQPDRRADYLAETEKECQKWIAAATRNFLVTLERVAEPGALITMDRVTFEYNFRLPRREELVVTTPAYEWSQSVFQTLVLLRAGGDCLGAFLDHAVAAVFLDSPGEHRRFLSVERLAHVLVRDEIVNLGKMARNAASKQREELRQKAESRLGQWNKFETRLQTVVKKEFLKGVPKRNLAGLLDGFPVDYTGVEPVMNRLMDSMDADDPDKAMAEIQDSLRELRTGWDRFTRESRAEIVRCQIATAALRGLFKGKPVAEVSKNLQSLGAELKVLEGSFELKRFGPKVDRVFQALR